MWKPDFIQFKDIISHKDTRYDFHNGIPILVFGVNKDAEKERSNGSGKSGFVEALSIAFKGEPIRKLRKSEYIRNGADSCEVFLSITNNFLNQNIKVKREIFKKSSAKFQVWVNDVEKTDITSNDELTKWLFEQLEFNKEDFDNYYLVTKNKYKSFFEIGDTKKKEIINRFSNADILDTVIENVDNDIKYYQNKVDNLEQEKTTLEGKLQGYEEQLENTGDNEEYRQKVINDIQNKINQLKEQKKEYTNKINELNQEYNELNKSFSKLEFKDYTDKINGYKEQERELDKEIENLNEQYRNIYENFFKKDVDGLENKKQSKDKEIRELQNNKKEIQDLIVDFEKKYKGIVKCPNCGFEFHISDEEISPEEVKSNLEELKELNQQTDQSINNLSNDIEEIQQKIQSYQQKVDNKKQEIGKALESKKEELNEIVKTYKELQGIQDKYEQDKKCYNNKFQEINDQITRYNNKIKDCDEDIENNKKQIEEEKNKDYSVNLQPIYDKISELKKDIKGKENEIKEWESEKQLCEECFYDFKKFKSYLANQSISTIEGYTNYFLSKMTSELQVKIEGYKLKSDGKSLSEKITTQVLRNGEFDGIYDKFSGGEKVTMDLALILTLQNIINQKCESGGLDLLITDEIIESIDSVGVEDIMKMLSNINQTTMHITHAPLMSEFENKIVFEKQNGVTNLI